MTLNNNLYTLRPNGHGRIPNYRGDNMRLSIEKTAKVKYYKYFYIKIS